MAKLTLACHFCTAYKITNYTALLKLALAPNIERQTVHRCLEFDSADSISVVHHLTITKSKLTPEELNLCFRSLNCQPSLKKIDRHLSPLHD